MFLTKVKIASAVVLAAVAAAGVAGALAQSEGDEKPGPGPKVNQPPRAKAPASRSSYTPDFISKSRVMILKRLEEESDKALLRFKRAASTAHAVRKDSPDEGPVVNEARKEFLDFQTRLDAIDRVLFDVIETHPTLFDFLAAQREKAGDPGDAEIQGGLDPTEVDAEVARSKKSSADSHGVVDRDLAPAEILRAKKRVDWAQRMFERGYVSRSQLDAEIASFERVVVGAVAGAKALKEQNPKPNERPRDNPAARP